MVARSVGIVVAIGVGGMQARSIKATELTRGMRLHRNFYGDTWRVLAVRFSSASIHVLVDVEGRDQPLCFRANATLTVRVDTGGPK